jgi:1,2-diacylglycerol 3-beta-glucosyltransferase
MMTLIQLTLLSIFGIFAGYLVLLSFFALKEKKSSVKTASVLRRFAIVVPAYNEAGCIARTVKNLLEIDYPDHLFDVIVIADNCTDQTAQIAAKAGAGVWERNNPDERGKGYALRWCFDRIVSENDTHKYDSVVVVDADSISSENLLEVFNDYREAGAEVIQGYLTVPVKPGVWTSETIRIGLTLYNYVRPLGRRWIGCSAGLRGNGMCFSLSTLQKVPWDAYSQTEDLEYGISLLLNNVEVVFAPEIIGYNEIPENARNAESQRERWEIGRLPVLKKYAGRLLKETLKKRSFKIFDAFIDLVTPPLVTMLLFMLLMAGLSFMFWFTGLEETLLYMWLWLALFAAGKIHAIVGLIAAGADKATYKSLLYVPRYALWKVYLYVKVFVFNGRATSWVRTARE